MVAAGKVAEKRQQSFTGLRQRLRRMRQVPAGAADGGDGGGIEVGNGTAKG
jgi:hypothetical protein